MEFPDVSSFPCPSPYRGCGGWQFGNQMHHLMRSFHPSIINITEGSISRPPGGKDFWKISWTYPQGSAQLLPEEGAWPFGMCRSVIPFMKAKSSLTRSCFFIAKKPGAFPSPMPNEFGVCMVYGRCCTRCDGARQAWVSRHFCRDRCLKSWISLLFFSLHCFLTISGKWWGRKAVPFSAFLHPIESFLMAIWETYGVISCRTAGFSCSSTI